MNEFPFPSVIDSSIMATLKSCSAKFSYEYIQNYKPKTAGSVHLVAGGAFAKGMEVTRQRFYIDGVDPDTAMAEGLGALLAAYGNFDPGDSPKSPERMAGAFEFYFSHYPLIRGEQDPIILPGGKAGIEFNFVHPLPVVHPQTGEPLLYSGRLDAIINFAGGVFMVDEKTTSQLGPTWSRQWDLRSQFTGYAWGCRESGIKVDGAIVRGVSILKTKYETQQAISYRPEWQIDRWLDELCEWLEQAISSWKRGRFLHNLDHSCAEYGGCPFRQACSSQDPQPWLETFFERRHWDPITRVETKL